MYLFIMIAEELCFITILLLLYSIIIRDIERFFFFFFIIIIVSNILQVTIIIAKKEMKEIHENRISFLFSSTFVVFIRAN